MSDASAQVSFSIFCAWIPRKSTLCLCRLVFSYDWAELVPTHPEPLSFHPLPLDPCMGMGSKVKVWAVFRSVLTFTFPSCYVSYVHLGSLMFFQECVAGLSLLSSLLSLEHACPSCATVALLTSSPLGYVFPQTVLMGVSTAHISKLTASL